MKKNTTTHRLRSRFPPTHNNVYDANSKFVTVRKVLCYIPYCMVLYHMFHLFVDVRNFHLLEGNVANKMKQNIQCPNNNSTNNATTLMSISTMKEIVQRASGNDAMVRIFHNASTIVDDPNNNNPLKSHPFAGAKGEHGHWGYVANVTSFRNWILERSCIASSTACVHPNIIADHTSEICQAIPGQGYEGIGWEALKDIEIAKKPQQETTSTSLSVLCAIYTYSGRMSHIAAVSQSWGWKCDGFLVVSNQTIPQPTSSDIPPIEIIDLPHLGPEAYWNMWQKTRSILGYLYTNYLQDFEYFYISGDDTFLIVENLKNFLYEKRQEQEQQNKSKHKNDYLFTGQEFWTFGEIYAINGGGGYVLSQSLLKVFVECSLPTCYANEFVAMEDVMISQCLQQLGIEYTNSVDKEGKQRFHAHYNAQEIAEGFYDKEEWFTKTRQHWASLYGVQKGTDYVSKYTIAFHKMFHDTYLRRYYGLLYRDLCPITTPLGEAFSKLPRNVETI